MVKIVNQQIRFTIRPRRGSCDGLHWPAERTGLLAASLLVGTPCYAIKTILKDNFGIVTIAVDPFTDGCVVHPVHSGGAA